MKIISASPSNTEIILNLGLGDNIIATDNYSANIDGMPDGIAVIDFTFPDPEIILSLSPDFVFVNEINRTDRGDDPFRLIRETGANVVYVPTSNSIDDIYNDILRVAQALGVADRGDELVGAMRSLIAAIADETGKNAGKQPKKVYFEVSPAPNMVTFGHNTFLDEMIDIAGGENVFKAENRWFTVSAEAVIAANPDIIFTNTVEYDDPCAEIKSRPGFGNIKAVASGKVFYVDPDSSSRPSPGIIKAIVQMKNYIDGAVN
jgi:iron complex transport system substrate-binding protein